MEKTVQATSPAFSSNSTFCPEFEYAPSQNIKKNKRKKNLKFCKDITKLQRNISISLNDFKIIKNSINIQELKNRRDEILDVIYYKKILLSKKSLYTFEKKLLQIEDALKEQQNPVQYSETNNISSVLLLEKNERTIEIPDTSQIETDNKKTSDQPIIEKQYTKEIESETERETSNHPLNLSVKDVQLNDAILESDLNNNYIEIHNPIDLSLKISHENKNLKYETISTKLSNPNRVNNIPIVNCSKITEKQIQNQFSLDNNHGSNKKLSDLSKAELDAIKEEFKTKIMELFNEKVNMKNSILDNLGKCLEESNMEKTEQIQNNERETENIFENLWSQSIQTSSLAQTMEYNDLKEALDIKELYKSDGTDTNHIAIDLSIDSNILRSSNTILKNDMKSHNLPNKYHLNDIKSDQNKKIYNLSEKHISRLATSLNLNIDYLKLQIRLCTIEYSRDYDIDDISVIAPSQSSINTLRIRKTKQIPHKKRKNLNNSKTRSRLDICGKSNYDVYRKLKKKMKRSRKSHTDFSNFYSNFTKR